MKYRIFTTQDALHYANQHLTFLNQSLNYAEEVGDGNLNLVFKLFDHNKQSRVILKQALPYVRCIGQSWPLTTQRTIQEAYTLLKHYEVAPEYTVKVLHYNVNYALIILEDLSDYTIWRSGLLKGENYTHATLQLGEYIAKTSFYTSDFYLDSTTKKQQVIKFTNPEMCKITEQLFFDDPYQVNILNHYPIELNELVNKLQNHRIIKQHIAQLKYNFLSHAEVLLHGDLHTGSIFVTKNKLKVIDAEFGYYGPIGFDLGVIIGNLLLNYCRLKAIEIQTVKLTYLQQQRLNNIQELWYSFSFHFKELAINKSLDNTLAQTDYIENFIRKIWQDALGYGGTELIRRTIGFAHVADLDGISSNTQRLYSQYYAIYLGKVLITQRNQWHTPEQLTAFIEKLGTLHYPNLP